MVDIEARVRQLHAGGVQATGAGRPAVGAQRLRRGLQLLGWSESATVDGVRHPRLVARLLISLAHAEAEQGRTRRGFALLDRAVPFTDPADEGVLVQQRGLMLQRTGNASDALRCLDAAIPLLVGSEHHAVLARTLLNRAWLHISGGRLREGRADLDQCATVATGHGLVSLTAKVWHNRAFADLLAGDVPSALASFARAEELYHEHAPDFVPVVQAARARALFTVGLYTEAVRDLDAAIPAFHRQRLSQDEAEATWLRAQAALALADLPAARRWADAAARGFRRRGNEAWLALAELIRLRIDPLPSRGFAARAATLTDRLTLLGLPADAELARLFRARALVATGHLAAAEQLLATRRQGHSFAWLETLLTRRLAEAELALARGEARRALARARAGLVALQNHRSTLGSLDLMVGPTAVGQQLAALGRRVAAEQGDVTTLLAWSERSRAQAFRVAPVKAPRDPVQADALSELRRLRNLMRTAELAGRREPGLAGRCAELERVVRERSWHQAGTGNSVPEATLGTLRPALAGRALVSFLVQGQRLSALVVDPDRSYMVELGPVGPVAETARRLLADLDALAGRRLPERMVEVIEGSMRRHVDQLDDELLRPLAGRLGARGVVVVPTGALAALPWAMLPTLRGRPVTLAPSATAWLNAEQRGSPAGGTGPLLVAGPHLRYAEAELADIAALYPDSRSLRGEHATVDRALADLDGAPMAHLAAHGHHEPDNGLFSRLDLADGPLMVYDLQQLAHVPRLITLSACDVGRAVVTPGDEHLGFTAALLHAGTACVVSSVCRVAHDTAARVMTALHRFIAAGASPAQALADASVDEPLATFVCFGAG